MEESGEQNRGKGAAGGGGSQYFGDDFGHQFITADTSAHQNVGLVFVVVRIENRTSKSISRYNLTAFPAPDTRVRLKVETLYTPMYIYTLRTSFRGSLP